MKGMFEECNSLKFLDLTNFNTRYVQNMERMFKGCKSLISINLVIFMSEMFEESSSLTSMFISI